MISGAEGDMMAGAAEGLHCGSAPPLQGAVNFCCHASGPAPLPTCRAGVPVSDVTVRFRNMTVTGLVQLKTHKSPHLRDQIKSAVKVRAHLWGAAPGVGCHQQAQRWELQQAVFNWKLLRLQV